MAAVVEEPVAPAGALAQAGHDVLDHAGDARVERVHRLARLEVDVRVLRRAADERALRRQRPSAVRADQLLGHQRAQVVVGEQLDGVELVRGPEAVEEVHERHARLQRGGLRDQREVVRLLDRRRGQQREARLPHRHHVGVVAEDRQPLRRQRAGSDVQHRTAFLRDVPGVEFERDGTVRVSTALMTGSPGVFAGGDMVPAERTVTVGVGHGKKAARHIDAWLRGAAAESRPKHDLATFDKLNLWFFGDAARRRQPELAPEERVAGSTRWSGACRWRRRPTRRAGACRAATAASATAASARAPRTR
jgi:hypothetical protein